jgi:hypothetical protein
MRLIVARRAGERLSDAGRYLHRHRRLAGGGFHGPLVLVDRALVQRRRQRQADRHLFQARLQRTPQRTFAGCSLTAATTAGSVRPPGEDGRVLIMADSTNPGAQREFAGQIPGAVVLRTWTCATWSRSAKAST